MKYGKLFTILTIIVISASATSVLFSTSAYAQPAEKTVHSKDSLLVGCTDLSPTFNSEKMKPGESRTVGCGTSAADMELKILERKVFYCNHDNWLTFPTEGYMKRGDVWRIKCVEP